MTKSLNFNLSRLNTSMNFCFMIGFLLFTQSNTVFGQCDSLIKGPVVMDVASCKQFNPETDFNLDHEDTRFIKDLDPAGRKKFFDSYRGLVLKGKIVQSSAVRKGITNEQGVLANQTITVFIPPGPNQCSSVDHKRVEATVDEACCNGGGDAPCLIGSGYRFPVVKVLGEAGSAAGDQKRLKAQTSPDIKAGDEAFIKKQYAVAAKRYEAALAKGELDVKGMFKMGYAYRESDKCAGAIVPLKKIYDLQQAGKIWGDEQEVARKAAFLLARCYAKANDSQGAVLILNGYLLEPRKYEKELREAMKNRDFGWIHTTKEYRDFKADAEKRLRKLPPK